LNCQRKGSNDNWETMNASKNWKKPFNEDRAVEPGEPRENGKGR